MKTSRILSISLWIAQIFLSVSLFWASAMKLFQPIDQLAEMWPWTAKNRELVIFTGIIDVLAAIGLLLPNIISPRTKLTTYTAYGIIILMISASLFHIFRGETSQIGINILFLFIALYITWGKKKQLKHMNSIERTD
ncbi:DoxX family protein [Chryseobacterium piperi]|uniref:DoxX family protein n=1 Tax=Chryseobacterium piperi TaxID=558152 RepID=UPI000553DBCB|nr:DoxX family protein [Chryseobacterium piperi]ASW76247.1 DoxX family protein [Chryseobacterium piperi]